MPPNPKQWENEHNGLDLRDDLGLSVDVELPHMDAFDLLPHVTVWAHGEVPAASKYIAYFRTEGRSSWSGLSIRIDEENELVLYNDAHPITRVRATLMEEFFHLRLGHPRSVVRAYQADTTRTYDGEVEQAAYGSGAAALVPYAGLKRLISEGLPVHAIAEHFTVSDELVRFRLKVTRLQRGNRRTGRSRKAQ